MTQGQYRSYKWRWYVLIVASLLNITNAFNWLTAGEIIAQTASLFDITPDQVNWFAEVFFVTGIPLIIPICYLLDTKGLRPCIIGVAWCNGIGAVLKVGGAFIAKTTYDEKQENQLSGVKEELHNITGFAVALFGQTLASLTQPIAISVGTKIAAEWFPEKQRTVANATISLANVLGIMLANITMPFVVETPEELPIALLYISIPSIIVAIMATFGIRSSTPRTPPSRSAATELKQPFKAGLKKLLKDRSFWMLMLSGGVGFGIFNILQAFLQQILCTKGYDNKFSGICGAAMIGSGIVISLIVGIVVDRTHRLVEAAKGCFGVACLGLFAFTAAANYQNEMALVAISICTVGGFALAAYPILLELGVECTFPVPEATSSGLIFLLGELIALVGIELGEAVATEISAADKAVQKCLEVTTSNSTTSNSTIRYLSSTVPSRARNLTSMMDAYMAPKEYLYLNIFDALIGTFAFVLFMTLFKGKYLRRIENAKKTEDRNKWKFIYYYIVTVSFARLDDGKVEALD